MVCGLVEICSFVYLWFSQSLDLLIDLRRGQHGIGVKGAHF